MNFKKLILMGKTKTKYQLVYFILNTLHHIVNSGGYYCYCGDMNKGKMCAIPIIFTGFKKDIEKNIFDYNFLFNELLQLPDHNKDYIECF